LGLHNAFIEVFKKGVRKDIIGCLFHHKQAVFKHMHEKCNFPKDLVHQLMVSGGPYDVLTIVPFDDMEKAIAYVMSKIDVVKYPSADIPKFISYFRRIWLGVYRHGGWNVHDLWVKHKNGSLTPDDIIFRCNNALESWNRWFGLRFPTKNPSVEIFLNVVREVLISKYNDLLLIQSGKLPPPERKGPQFPEIPADYESFRVSFPSPSQFLFNVVFTHFITNLKTYLSLNLNTLHRFLP
jgi:hypothetical protein